MLRLFWFDRPVESGTFLGKHKILQVETCRCAATTACALRVVQAARDHYHARGAGALQIGQEQVCEEEMPEMVDTNLLLEALLGEPALCVAAKADARVAEEKRDTSAFGLAAVQVPELCHKSAHRLQIGQVELQDLS